MRALARLHRRCLHRVWDRAPLWAVLLLLALVALPGWLAAIAIWLILY